MSSGKIEHSNNRLAYLFGDVNQSEDIAPLRTGDIYGRFDYDDPLLLLRERMLLHTLLEAAADRTVDMGTPLSQLAGNLTPIEVTSIQTKSPEWARRAVLLRLAHVGLARDTSVVQVAILRDETYRCFVALASEAQQHAEYREDIRRIRAALLRHALGAGHQPLGTDPRRIIQEMVISRHGSNIWCELTSTAERDVDRLDPACAGADMLAARLIEVGAALLGRSRDEFLHDISTYCNEMVSRVSGDSVMELLENLNEIHRSIAQVAPKYPLPNFAPDESNKRDSYVYEGPEDAPWADTLAAALNRRFRATVSLRSRHVPADQISRGPLKLLDPSPMASTGSATGIRRISAA